MAVDNTIYDRDAEHWWSGQGHLSLLQAMIPARIDYLQRLEKQLDSFTLPGSSVLDIGCGGGLFTERLAQLGCDVVGVEPSQKSIDVARQHAADGGHTIRYEVAAGEQIPFDDGTFDLVSCCDVLEHVDDVGVVVAEGARVLKPGGIYLYDTLNRNWLSRFVAVTLFQEWLGIAPTGLHDADMFITPAEMDEALDEAGLESAARAGLTTDMGPVASLRRLWNVRRLKRGQMDHEAFGRTMMFRVGGPLLINYIGHAVRV